MSQREWRARDLTELRYHRAMRKAAKYIQDKVKNLTTIEEIQAAIEEVADSRIFQGFARKEALKMVQALATENARTWKEAAKQSGRPAKIYAMLRDELMTNKGKFIQLANENADLIKKMPLSVKKTITREAGIYAVRGLRSGDLVAKIQERVPEISKARAQLIARTEISKTNAAITRIRSEEAGVGWYIWRTSEDGRVRDSHEHVDGVLCRFDDPPAPELLIGEKSQGHYNPGDIWNCRCYAEPVVSLDLITFPAKVYYNGKIERLSKKRFLELQVGGR